MLEVVRLHSCYSLAGTDFAGQSVVRIVSAGVKQATPSEYPVGTALTPSGGTCPTPWRSPETS